MGAILAFLAENVATLIRVLSVIVALVSGYLLYRLLFASADEIVAAQSSDVGALNKKVSEQKTEIDSLKTENTIIKTELETHRTEVYNLRQTVKEKETQIESVTTQLAAVGGPEGAAVAAKMRDYEMHKPELILSSQDEKLLFEKEIAELKRRLSDYEIIAEDIADMQKLKEENEKLKQQVGQVVGSAPSADSNTVQADSAEASAKANATEAAPVAAEVDPADLLAQELDLALSQVETKIETKSETKIETRPDGVTVETESLDGPLVSEETLEPNLEASLDPNSLVVDEIGEAEKSLMEKFEKQKGS